MILDWVTFRGTNPRGERRHGSLEQFLRLLTTRHRAQSKTLAPGFSATRYRQEYLHTFTSDLTGETKSFTVTAPACWRSAAGVDAVTAAVLDLDGYTPDWAALERTRTLVAAFTTWSHTLKEPHWRLVIPFAAPIAVEYWPSAFAAALERFEPRADQACKDASHLFWLCAGPPATDEQADTRVIDGALWALTGLAVSPPTETSFTSGLHVADPGRAATPLEQAAAVRLLEATCRRLAEWPSGGRQVRAYGTARFVGHLVAANALDQQAAEDALWEAVRCNGVGLEREAETRRALRRGLAKGAQDGAYDFAGRWAAQLAELVADTDAGDHAEQVHLDPERGTWRCEHCAQGGDAVDWLRLVRHYTFAAAKAVLETRAW